MNMLVNSFGSFGSNCLTTWCTVYWGQRKIWQKVSSWRSGARRECHVKCWRILKTLELSPSASLSYINHETNKKSISQATSKHLSCWSSESAEMFRCGSLAWLQRTSRRSADSSSTNSTLKTIMSENWIIAQNHISPWQTAERFKARKYVFCRVLWHKLIGNQYSQRRWRCLQSKYICFQDFKKWYFILGGGLEIEGKMPIFLLFFFGIFPMSYSKWVSTNWKLLRKEKSDNFLSFSFETSILILENIYPYDIYSSKSGLTDQKLISNFLLTIPKTNIDFLSSVFLWLLGTSNCLCVSWFSL